MAQRVEIQIIDDLDGGRGDETVLFSYEGKQYEIDLSSKNAKKLRDTLGRYASAGRKVTGARRAAGRRVARRIVPAGPSNAEVREWARANGYPVADRGRLNADIVVKFQEAHV